MDLAQTFVEQLLVDQQSRNHADHRSSELERLVGHDAH
jgi:hypothetical protein